MKTSSWFVLFTSLTILSTFAATGTIDVDVWFEEFKTNATS